MSYTYNHTEEFVKNMYEEIDVRTPEDLKKGVIARRLGLTVNRVPASSMRINKNIYLDSRISEPVSWQQFGHELCHALWHQDNQLHLSQDFIDLQEYQANLFAYYACVPTTMLMELDLPETLREAVHKVVTTFNVTSEFAQKRLELHTNKLYQESY